MSPNRRVLLNVDSEDDTIDIHYSDSGGTNTMNFSFVSRISIPIPWAQETFPLSRTPLDLAFSADGSKFAMTISLDRVSVWDSRSKIPIKTFMEVSKSDHNDLRIRYLQFSSGKLGKAALVFVEVRLIFIF